MSHLRLLLLAALVGAAFTAAATLLPHSPSELRSVVIAAGAPAPLLALAAWLVLTPALFPGTVLAVACGLTFGIAGGTAVAWGGAVIGGVASFALARTVGHGPLERVGGDRLHRLSTLLARRGFVAVLAARLTPGVPASGVHYAAGLASVRVRDFTAAMAVGALVRTVPYAILGAGLASGSMAMLIGVGASVLAGAAAAALLLRRLRAVAAA